MSTDSIFIANIGEIDIPLTKFMNPGRKTYQIFENHALCDRFIFSDEDNRILITPFPLDNQFIKDNCRLLNFKNFHNLFPLKLEESISQSILKDDKLHKALIETIKSNPNINLLAYTASPEFIDFISHLRKKGLTFRTPELPAEKNLWTIDFFGSKAGFRQVVSCMENDDLPLPEGYICSSISETIGWASYLLKTKGGCVIKTNRGTAGEGVKITKKKDIEGKKVNEYISNFINSEPCWRTYPLIVEEYIAADLAVAGGNPSIEFKVEDDKIIPLYACGMRVTPEGAFKGVEFGRNALPKNLEDYLYKIGDDWAKFLQRFGYRGFFDIDLVYNGPGKVFPLESNVRRTGGTHVYEIAKRLLEKNFLDNYYIVANNIFEAPKFRNRDYQFIKSVLQPILYPIDGKKEGVIITIYHLLQEGKLGYAVVGPDRMRVMQIESDFLKLLGNKIN